MGADVGESLRSLPLLLLLTDACSREWVFFFFFF
jgi:hypothetical protein